MNQDERFLKSMHIEPFAIPEMRAPQTEDGEEGETFEDELEAEVIGGRWIGCRGPVRGDGCWRRLSRADGLGIGWRGGCCDRGEAMTHRKSISTRERFRIFARDGFRCQYCGLSAPDVALQVDHVDPVANGGAHHESNFITACSYCNAGKSDMSGIAELIDQKLMDRFEGGYEMYVEHPDDYGTARIHQFSGRECGDAVEPVGIDFDIESAASELPSALFAPVEVGTWEAF